MRRKAPKRLWKSARRNSSDDKPAVGLARGTAPFFQFPNGRGDLLLHDPTDERTHLALVRKFAHVRQDADDRFARRAGDRCDAIRSAGSFLTRAKRHGLQTARTFPFEDILLTNILAFHAVAFNAAQALSFADCPTGRFCIR